jgi:predicted nucleic acid-binding protein
VGLAPTYLLDKSAFARINTEPSVAAVVLPLLGEGAIAVSGVLMLEAGYSARNAAEHGRIRVALGAMPQAPITPADWERAVDVQGQLADRGQHRSAGLADLILAASAERSGLTLLHYDADFDLIAAVTQQPARWVVPRGSLPARAP